MDPELRPPVDAGPIYYPEGSLLSHYRVLGRIGAGGMGVVYSAVDTPLNRTLALKVIAHSLVGDPARRKHLFADGTIPGG